MSDRPTPRTASAMMEIPSKFNSIWVVPAETACDLERELGDALCERDEARAERDKLQAMRREVVAANKGAKINAQINNSLTAKLAEAKRERDEAREELAEAKREAENLAKSIYRSEYSDNDTDWELLDSVAGVISQIDNMYAGVREQRDEARQEWGKASMDAAQLLSEKTKIMAERDQLKEALLIMENLLKPGIELFPEIGEILKQRGVK